MWSPPNVILGFGPFTGRGRGQVDAGRGRARGRGGQTQTQDVVKHRHSKPSKNEELVLKVDLLVYFIDVLIQDRHKVQK